MDKRFGRSGIWLDLLHRLLDANGGKMNGKLLLAIVVVALLVIAGFVAFRVILVDMILTLKDSR
ncbi:hypothetical protein [Microbispora bryophytorum]|uniref:Uncharacterized protein n=2 Tax=Microbispora bryophytorum TaxID=1460882 RepID=A0A8H9LEM2_9ACTN|nr:MULTISPECIES: hypothetical protein [Microbispora]MBD3139545.1 hypothetical protein [Microbispora bryophytorum]MBD3148036.1 hypothetical protein [Microbispora camponoti]TQS02842.1 hypothetical protein FLX07_26255 [Microbispora bryophytorum]GGO02586.1 hypothetical protein GCM10011574_11540 [Microbispora bryophytorum]